MFEEVRFLDSPLFPIELISRLTIVSIQLQDAVTGGDKDIVIVVDIDIFQSARMVFEDIGQVFQTVCIEIVDIKILSFAVDPDIVVLVLVKF